jgi:hypothetical protein
LVIGWRGGRVAGGRDEVLRLLAEREAACRVELERLAAEAERIGGLIEACRVELERVATARTVVGELVAATETTTTAVAGPSGELSAAGGDARAFAEQVLDLLTARGHPVRCRGGGRGTGPGSDGAPPCGTGAAPVEETRRSRRVVEVTPGAFTLPGDCEATVG